MMEYAIMLDPNSDPRKFSLLNRQFIARSALTLGELEFGIYYKFGELSRPSDIEAIVFGNLESANFVGLYGDPGDTRTALGEQLRSRVRSFRTEEGLPQFNSFLGKNMATFCFPRQNPGGENWFERFESIMVFAYDLELRLNTAFALHATTISAPRKLSGAEALARRSMQEQAEASNASFLAYEKKRVHRLFLLINHDVNILLSPKGIESIPRDFNFSRHILDSDGLSTWIARFAQLHENEFQTEIHLLVEPKMTPLGRQLQQVTSSLGLNSQWDSLSDAPEFQDGDLIVLMNPNAGSAADSPLSIVRVQSDSRLISELFPNGLSAVTFSGDISS